MQRLQSALKLYRTINDGSKALTGLYGLYWITLDYDMVPKAGLEPARLSPLPPQDSVSTNSTTWAFSRFLFKR